MIPKPVVSGIRKKPLMLIGQAGQDIRKVFEDTGVYDFDESVWSSEVVKRYPGRKLVKSKRQQGFRSVDETPPASMVKNCQPFLMRQIELAEPQIMVTSGGFPLKAYFLLRGRPAKERKLESFVGTEEDWDGSEPSLGRTKATEDSWPKY